MTGGAREIPPLVAAQAMRDMPRLARDLAISAADNVADVRHRHLRWKEIDAKQRRGVTAD